jgi:hypothetical protein
MVDLCRYGTVKLPHFTDNGCAHKPEFGQTGTKECSGEETLLGEATLADESGGNLPDRSSYV